MGGDVYIQRKHGWGFCSEDSLSFVQIDVEFLNVAAVLRFELDRYIFAAYRSPNYCLENESFIFY